MALVNFMNIERNIHRINLILIIRSEKDVFSWVKDKITELFADDIVVDDDQMKIVITDTDEMEVCDHMNIPYCIKPVSNIYIFNREAFQ